MSELPPLPRARVFHLLLAAGIYFSSIGFLVHFPRYVLRAGGTVEDAGWLLALGLIPTLLLGARTGEWNQRWGGRAPALFGGLLAALSNVLMVWINDVSVWMYVLRLTFAVGHTLVFGTLLAQAAFMVDNPLQRAKVIGWTALVIQVGNAIGGAFGEWAYFHSNATFWLVSAALATIAALLGLGWSHKPHAATTDRAPISVKMSWPGEVWAMVAVGVAFAGPFVFLPPFIDHLGDTGATSPFAVSWFVTPALLVVALVRLVGGYFARFLMRPWVIGGCHALLVLTFLLMPWLSTREHAIALGLVFGLSYGWLYPALYALAFSNAPAHMRGKLSGLMMAAFEVGFRLSPIGFGIVITHWGYHAMFASLALTYLLVLSVSWFRAKPALQITGAVSEGGA